MSTSASNFDENLLDIDCERVVGEIAEALRETVFKRFLRKGLVLGLSGGIDSSVCAALAARALGPERVLGLLMPERESASCHEAQELATVLAECLGIESITEDISSTLDAAGCYSRRDEALRSVLPEYGPGWKCKIVLPSVVNDDRYRFFSVVARDPDGNMVTKRLKPAAYLGVVAATNFKQRVRKMMEYSTQTGSIAQ